MGPKYFYVTVPIETQYMCGHMNPLGVARLRLADGGPQSGISLL